MIYVSKSAEETKKIASDFAKTVSLEGRHQGARIVGLYGELGAGKTTFMKGVAEFFDIKETIQSPTFVIMKRYDTSPPGPLSYGRRGGRENGSSLGGEVLGGAFDHLIHIDCYRIDKSDELVKLGWREIIADSKNIIFIEWPERIADIMPAHSEIYFEHINENQRKIKIE